MTISNDDCLKAAKSGPEALNDQDLENAAGGGLLKDLKGITEATYFDDGQIVNKIVHARRGGSGNVHHGGQAPAGDEYKFHEDLGDQLVPVTYKLID